MFLRKKNGGATIDGHEWAEDGAVAEVPDELGADLLSLAPDEYEHVVDEPADGDQGDQGDQGDVKKPNQAASAADWQAYALTQGLPAEVVEAATRKQIIDHFNGGQSLTEQA
jgi:hypothetical protein